MRFWLPVFLFILAFYEGIVRWASTGDPEARTLYFPTARFVLLAILVGGAAAYRIRRRDDVAVFLLSLLAGGGYYAWIAWPGTLSIAPVMLLGLAVGWSAGARGVFPVALVLLAGGAFETASREWQDSAPVLQASFMVFLFAWVAGLTAMVRAARSWLTEPDEEPALTAS